MQPAGQSTQHVAYGHQGVAFGAMPTIMPAQPPPSGLRPHQQKAMKTLAGFQIAIGISCVIIHVVLLSIKRNDMYADFVGAGIWCGAFYILAGSLGLAAARKNKLSLIISTMTMSVISSVLLWVVVGIASGAISQSVTREDDPCNWNSYGSSRSSGYSFSYTCYIPNYSGYKAADSILLILSVAEFIVSIWTAVLCCKGSCRACCSCCCYGCDYSYQTPVMYYASAQAAGPQMIVLPQSHILGGQAIGMMSAQQGYSIGQQQVMFVHPGSAPAYGQSGICRPPEYSAAQVEAPSVCQSGELTKEQMAACSY